jgi:hypothetical protein
MGSWSYSAGTVSLEDWNLDQAITDLLARLPSDKAVWQMLHSRYRVDLFCGLFMGSFNQGTDLKPPTLVLLAERGLTLTLDIYVP